MVTSTSGIEWAVAFIKHRMLRWPQYPTHAALVRGNLLYTRDPGSPLPADAVYEFVPNGGAQPKHSHLEFETAEGNIYFLYAWLDDMESYRDEDGEVRKALRDAQQKLEVYTNPTDRLEKLIELLRWSHAAQTGDHPLPEE